MRLFTVLGVACSLSACQTVNGIDNSSHPAQVGETFCERNLIVCIVVARWLWVVSPSRQQDTGVAVWVEAIDPPGARSGELCGSSSGQG